MTRLFEGSDQLRAYEALRELVRKVESGEVEIRDMSITSEAPATQSFRSMDGRMDRTMVTRLGDVRVELTLALMSYPVSEPGYVKRDEAGRLRGDVGVPGRSRGYSGGFVRPFSRDSQMSYTEMMGMTAGPSAPRGEKYPTPSPTPQEPADPLKYGARKLDID